MGQEPESPQEINPTTTPAELQKQESLPAVMTVDELADLLRINRDTAYRAIAEGQIPGTRRIRGTIRISRDAVLSWLSGEGRDWRSRRRT